MKGSSLVFRLHALRRMFERAISDEEVRHVLEAGATIGRYPDDRPYPSRLVLGFSKGRPIHVVVADNDAEQESIIITVYEPDPKIWSSDFRRRRQK